MKMVDDRDIKLMLGALPPSVRDIGLRLVDEVRQLRVTDWKAAFDRQLEITRQQLRDFESRTEAEQRVLDANSELDPDWLSKCEFSRDIRIVNFARAELACRGLK